MDGWMNGRLINRSYLFFFLLLLLPPIFTSSSFLSFSLLLLLFLLLLLPPPHLPPPPPPTFVAVSSSPSVSADTLAPPSIASSSICTLLASSLLLLLRFHLFIFVVRAVTRDRVAPGTLTLAPQTTVRSVETLWTPTLAEETPPTGSAKTGAAHVIARCAVATATPTQAAGTIESFVTLYE